MFISVTFMDVNEVLYFKIREIFVQHRVHSNILNATRCPCLLIDFFLETVQYLMLLECNLECRI